MSTRDMVLFPICRLQKANIRLCKAVLAFILQQRQQEKKHLECLSRSVNVENIMFFHLFCQSGEEEYV